MLVYGGNCQQRRDCNMVFIHTAVGKNQDIRTLPVRLIHLYEQMLQHTIHRCALIENDRHTDNLKTGLFHRADLQQVEVCQDRIIDLQYLTIFRLFFQKISVLAGIYGCGSDDFFPDRIDRRVRYLREQLLEIIKQRLIFFGKDSQRCIHTHRADPFGSV